MQFCDTQRVGFRQSTIPIVRFAISEVLRSIVSRMADPCSKAVEMRHLPFQCTEHADSNAQEEYRRESEFPLSFFSSPFVRFTAQEHPAISNFASAAMNREHWSPWSPWGSAPDEPNHGLATPGNPFAKSSNPSLFRGNRNQETPFRDTRRFVDFNDHG